MKTLVSNSGVALILAGLFFVITNVVISPQVDFDASFGEVLTSTAFSYRMISAAITVAFLLFGSVGLYLHHCQNERFFYFRHVAFVLTFFGTVFVFANEWHQIFVLPEIARISPEAIAKFDASDDTGLFETGAMLALVTFSIGWFLFMISLLLDGKLRRSGPALVLIGFVAIPLGSVIWSPVWGAMAGSICYGIGFCLMGVELIKSDSTKPGTADC